MTNKSKKIENLVQQMVAEAIEESFFHKFLGKKSKNPGKAEFTRVGDIINAGTYVEEGHDWAEVWYNKIVPKYGNPAPVRTTRPVWDFTEEVRIPRHTYGWLRFAPNDEHVYFYPFTVLFPEYDIPPQTFHPKALEFVPVDKMPKDIANIFNPTKQTQVSGPYR